MSVVTNRSQKPKVKPVSGTCQWLVPINPEIGVGALAINGKPYVVTVLKDGNNTVGYRLEKPDSKTYEIDAQTWECNCPDATFRERQCKHALALRAALAAADK